MATPVKRSKHVLVYGRRPKGSHSGASPAKHLRRAWGERPEDRCPCHHASPCPRATTPSEG